MAITPDSLDYTTKDFGSIRRRLFQLIRSVFADWTDEQTVDFGNILVELFARTGDVLTFYQDRQANESRITTALLRKSLIALGKLTAFQARGATAASATLRFTLVNLAGVPTPASADVVLPVATLARTKAVPSSVAFQLLADLTIPTGSTTTTATVENSLPQEDSFISTGAKNQRFRLPATPFLDGSLSVVAGNGAFTVVESFVASTGTDRHCTVAVDENDSAVVTFGDGALGVIPTGTIVLTYKTWGGLVGKLGPGTIVKLDGTFADANGVPVKIAVTNEEATTLGVDRQTVEELRALIPKASRVQRAAVAREDFEIGALGVSGVARALHLTSNEDTSIQENRGFLYLVTNDGSAPSQLLIDTVKARFFPVDGFPKPDLPALNTYRLTVLGAHYLDVDITAKVYKRKGTTAAAVKAAVLASLTSFFAIKNPDGSVNTRIDFGYALQDVDGNPTNLLAFSDIYDAVKDTAGVLRIGSGAGDFLLNGKRSDVPIAQKEFPRLGAVVLVDGDTGVVL